MRISFLIYFSFIFLAALVPVKVRPSAGRVSKWDNIKFDNGLSSILFRSSRVFKDSSYINDKDVFNIPIRSNIYASGSCFPDTLVFCKGKLNHDTIDIQVFAPSRCCMDNLFIRIYQARFTSHFVFSFDIAPNPVLIKPITQHLILTNEVYKKGDLIEGYIDFCGIGKDPSEVNENMILIPGEAKRGKVDTVYAKGYFKFPLQ